MVVISAQEMLQEMRRSGLTDQAIATMVNLDQGHTTRIRTGKRKNIWPATYDAIHTVYILWVAEKAVREKGKAA